MAATQRKRVSRGSKTRENNDSSTTTPFDLTPHNPNRPFPLQNDVAYFPFKQSHALLTDTTEVNSFERLWLNGYHAGETDYVTQTEIDYLAEIEGITVVASDVTSPADVWWLLDDTQFPDVSSPLTHRDVGSPSRLEWHRDRDRIGVNEFLEHPLIDHNLGGVPGWKAAFTATYNGRRVAVAVLSRPSARKLDADKIISLSRYAAHPNRPQNTASWLLGRARRWAALEGYEQLRTYAGVSNDNKGTIYQATGFEFDGMTNADGSGWTNRDGRDEWDDYSRRRYVYQLGAYAKPDPDTLSVGQPSLDAFTDATTDRAYRARLDNAPEPATDAFNSFETTTQPNDVVREADAIFGTVKNNTITSVIPVTYDKRTHESEILGTAFDKSQFDHPVNTATSIVSDIIDWIAFEGGSTRKLSFTGSTEFEHAVNKQLTIYEP